MAKKDKGGAPRKYTEEFARGELGALLAWLNEHPDNLYLKAFTVTRGYPFSYLSGWCKQWPALAPLLEAAHDQQEVKLAQGILCEKYNTTAGIFLLKAVAGLRDGREGIVGDKDDPLHINITTNGK